MRKIVNWFVKKTKIYRKLEEDNDIYILEMVNKEAIIRDFRNTLRKVAEERDKLEQELRELKSKKRTRKAKKDGQ
jgi:hypothetical protein